MNISNDSAKRIRVYVDIVSIIVLVATLYIGSTYNVRSLLIFVPLVICILLTWLLTIAVIDINDEKKELFYWHFWISVVVAIIVVFVMVLDNTGFGNFIVVMTMGFEFVYIGSLGLLTNVYIPPRGRPKVYDDDNPEFEILNYLYIGIGGLIFIIQLVTFFR